MDGSQNVAPVPHGGHHHSGGEAHAITLGGYSTGLLLSILLTAVPFGLVMSGAVSAAVAVPVCVALAVVQMVVHLRYFLHMNGSSDNTWNNAAFVFAVIVVAILVAGSLWVMHNMDVNMMPGMMTHR
jgi:cytochrome o ubiquinol oxidase operon protein cyoD